MWYGGHYWYLGVCQSVYREFVGDIDRKQCWLGLIQHFTPLSKCATCSYIFHVSLTDVRWEWWLDNDFFLISRESWSYESSLQLTTVSISFFTNKTYCFYLQKAFREFATSFALIDCFQTNNVTHTRLHIVIKKLSQRGRGDWYGIDFQIFDFHPRVERTLDLESILCICVK